MKRILAIAAGALVLAAAAISAQAAPLEPGEVAANAKWFVHIDFDALRNSKIGEYIHEKAASDEHIQKIVAKLKDKIGLDLHKDLHGVTLYGTSFVPHTGVLIVNAHADGPKFMAELKSKPDFVALKTADGKHDIYSYTETIGHPPMMAKKPAPGPERPEPRPEPPHERMLHELMMPPHHQTVWAAFPKKDMGVFSDSAAHLIAALAVIDGEGGLSSSSPLLPEAREGTIAIAGASGLSALPLPPHMALAKQIESIHYVSGETEGEDFKQLKLTMTNATVAGQLKTVVDGLQAMVQIHCADHPEVLNVINAMKTEVSGNELSIDWKASSAEVTKFLDKVCEFIRKHHERP